MSKLTLAEFEVIDRIKIDALISLLINEDIIDKSELSRLMKNSINNLVDCSSKENIKAEINKFLTNL